MNDIKVFISTRESICSECGTELGHHAWITLYGEGKAACLSCSDLEHLEYLPAGDAALTRRSRKYSKLSAVVLKWSRRRKRYERQGLLVEKEALEKAEIECKGDEEARKIARMRAAARREELDQEYIKKFKSKLKEMFPSCPEGREAIIAEHACEKYSGRIGRSAAAKELSNDAVNLAVIAHIRHRETNYDDLMIKGYNRGEAREMVQDKIDEVLDKWSG